VGEPFTWHEGNGAVPFPGRRVETASPYGFQGMIRYEIREYLGNETVVSYVQMMPGALDPAYAWRVMEAEFMAYLWRPASEAILERLYRHE
jgi:hypothetical protein